MLLLSRSCTRLLPRRPLARLPFSSHFSPLAARFLRSAFSLCAGTRIRPGDVQQWLKRSARNSCEKCAAPAVPPGVPPPIPGFAADGGVELSHDMHRGLDQRNSSFDLPLTTACFGSSTNAARRHSPARRARRRPACRHAPGNRTSALIATTEFQSFRCVEWILMRERRNSIQESSVRNYVS